MTAGGLGWARAGELLDRAVALFVRYRGPLLFILLSAEIPYQLLNFIPGPSLWQAGEIRGAGQLPGVVRAFFVTIGIPVLIGALVRTAVYGASRAAIDGERIRLAPLFVLGVRRWPAQTAVSALLLLVTLAGVAVWFIPAGIVAAIVTGLQPISRNFAIAMGIALGAPVVMCGLAFLCFMQVAWEIATAGIALEKLRPHAAVARGMERVFGGSFRRTLPVAIAYTAMTAVTEIALLSVPDTFDRIPLARFGRAAVETAINVVCNGTSALFVLLFLRRFAALFEGADLMRAVLGVQEPADVQSIAAPGSIVPGTTTLQ